MWSEFVWKFNSIFGMESLFDLWLCAKLLWIFQQSGTLTLSIRMLSITGGIITDAVVGLLIALDCVCLWKYIWCAEMCFCRKVHDQNTHNAKYAIKTTSWDNCKLCLAVRAERGENENNTELPYTRVSAALETLQEIFISARFMYTSLQRSYV